MRQLATTQSKARKRLLAHYESFLICADRRDLRREALFFLMSPDFEVLSSAFWTVGKSLIASALFLVAIAFSNCLRMSRSERLRRTLSTRRRSDWRRALAADAVFGMSFSVPAFLLGVNMCG